MDEDELNLVTGMPGGFPSGRQMTYPDTGVYAKGAVAEGSDSSADEEMSDYDEPVPTRYRSEHGVELPLLTGSSKYDLGRESTVTPPSKPVLAGVGRGWLKGCLNLSLGIQRR